MKELPYEIRPKQCFHDLISKYSLVIPDEQRPFGWTREEWVSVVVKNIFEAFDDDRQYHGGTIIILKSQADEIRDAQHRITIVYLIILGIVKLSKNDKYKEKTLELLAKMDDRDGIQESPSEEDIAIYEENGWKYLPKIRSSYDHDFKELGDYINSCIQPMYSCQVKKGCLFKSSCQEELDTHIIAHGTNKTPLFVCHLDCVFSCKAKAEFEQHILDVHGEVELQEESLIKSAHETIEELLQVYTEEQRKELCKYLFRNVLFDIMETTDLDFSRELSSQINNVGVMMPVEIRLRNGIISKVSKATKPKVIALFKDINSRASAYPLMKGHRVLFVAQNILRRQWVTMKQFTDSGNFTEIFDDNPTEDPNEVFHRFESTIDRCFGILDHIAGNTYGKMLSSFTKGYEIFVNMLIPIGCVFGVGVLDKYYNLLITQSIHTQCGVPLSINGKAYCNTITLILKKLSGGEPEPKLYEEFMGVFNASRKLQTKETFINAYTTNNFKNSGLARVILQYIDVKTSSGESSLNMDMIDLEHIIPKGDKGLNMLESPDLRHTLGNLTLFLGPNPKQGRMRGNRSLQDATFDVKVVEYRKSSIMMTRELGNYTEFKDNEIKERSKEIANKLFNLA